MIRQPTYVAVEDDATERALSAVVSVLTEIGSKEIVSGELLKDIALVSGAAKKVAHKLDRKPNGWIIIRKSANANVWETTALADAKFIVLNCSANVTLSLWVF